MDQKDVKKRNIRSYEDFTKDMNKFQAPGDESRTEMESDLVKAHPGYHKIEAEPAFTKHDSNYYKAAGIEVDKKFDNSNDYIKPGLTKPKVNTDKEQEAAEGYQRTAGGTDNSSDGVSESFIKEGSNEVIQNIISQLEKGLEDAKNKGDKREIESFEKEIARFTGGSHQLIGRLKNRLGEEENIEESEGELQVEPWRDDFHVTKGDGKAISINGVSVFSTQEEAQAALDSMGEVEEEKTFEGNIFTFESFVGEEIEEEEFRVDGTYTASNAGGYEIMLAPSGDAAKVRDAFGSENPETSDWLEIEYVDGEEESEPVIDPNGFNIPLNQVMRSK